VGPVGVEPTTIGLKGTYPIIVVRAPAEDTNSAVLTAGTIRCPLVQLLRLLEHRTAGLPSCQHARLRQMSTLLSVSAKPLLAAVAS
jgi:hypothetical protein